MEQGSGKDKDMMRFALNAEDKKILIKRIGELTGIQPRYTFMPRCAYEIGAYTVERRGDLVVEETDLDETIIQTLISEGLIKEGVREEDRMDAVIEAATQSAAESAPAAEETRQEAEEPETAMQDSLTISLPMSKHTADSLRRLVNLIYSRGPLLSKATGGHFGADKELITALDEAGIITTTASFISMVKEHGGLTGLTFADNKINFTGFPLTEDVDMNTAFQQIACLMNAHALDQKRIQAKVVNDDNEKYAFRIWLLRIGMNGDEFKASRKILMENLSGHSAFRTKDEEERWKARQKEKREELKAAKAAMKAEEEATKEAGTDEE
jgi:hypothetical protein